MKKFRLAIALGLFCAAARAATHDVEAGSDWSAVISEAASGDTIQVHNPPPAPVDVIVDKLLHFVNYPGESPVLDGAGTAVTAFKFEAGGDGSTVTGLTFQGYASYALDGGAKE